MPPPDGEVHATLPAAACSLKASSLGGSVRRGLHLLIVVFGPPRCQFESMADTPSSRQPVQWPESHNLSQAWARSLQHASGLQGQRRELSQSRIVLDSLCWEPRLSWCRNLTTTRHCWPSSAGCLCGSARAVGSELEPINPLPNVDFSTGRVPLLHHSILTVHLLHKAAPRCADQHVKHHHCRAPSWRGSCRCESTRRRRVSCTPEPQTQHVEISVEGRCLDAPAPAAVMARLPAACHPCHPPGCAGGAPRGHACPPQCWEIGVLCRVPRYALLRERFSQLQPRRPYICSCSPRPVAAHGRVTMRSGIVDVGPHI